MAGQNDNRVLEEGFKEEKLIEPINQITEIHNKLDSFLGEFGRQLQSYNEIAKADRDQYLKEFENTLADCIKTAYRYVEYLREEITGQTIQYSIALYDGKTISEQTFTLEEFLEYLTVGRTSLSRGGQLKLVGRAPAFETVKFDSNLNNDCWEYLLKNNGEFHLNYGQLYEAYKICMIKYPTNYQNRIQDIVAEARNTVPFFQGADITTADGVYYQLKLINATSGYAGFSVANAQTLYKILFYYNHISKLSKTDQEKASLYNILFNNGENNKYHQVFRDLNNALNQEAQKTMQQLLKESLTKEVQIIDST